MKNTQNKMEEAALEALKNYPEGFFSNPMTKEEALEYIWKNFVDGNEVTYKGNTYNAYKSKHVKNAFKLLRDGNTKVVDISEIGIEVPLKDGHKSDVGVSLTRILPFEEKVR